MFDGVPRDVLKSAIAGHFEIVTSEEIVAKFDVVLRRSKFGLSAEFVHAAVRECESLARLHYPVERHIVDARFILGRLVPESGVLLLSDYPQYHRQFLFTDRS